MGVRRVVAVIVAGVLAAALAGCSAPLDCGTPTATVPASAESGASITLRIYGLYPDCQAEQQRYDSSVVPGQVTVTLEQVDRAPISSVTEPVDDDAQATVVLEIPDTASGTYDVTADGNLLGLVTVTPAG